MPAMTRAGRRLSANQSQENTIVINADHPIQPEKPMAMKKTARKRGALTDISNNVPTKKRTTLKQNPKSMNLVRFYLGLFHPSLSLDIYIYSRMIH